MQLPRLRPLEIFQAPEADNGPSIVLRDPEGYSDEELVLSEAALFIAAHFDGEHTLEQALEAFTERFGSRPEEEEVHSLLDRLDAAFFLETEAFEERCSRLLDDYREAPQRPAAHAGISYPTDPAQAQKAITGFFEKSLTLEEPGPHPDGTLRGLVAPHIDLRHGGACTALAYRCLAEAPRVETVVVLGTAHACPYPAWVVTDKPFETPVGTVAVDRDACRVLREAAGAPEQAEFLHRREHSVEFQAVFLAALGRLGRELKFVPVLCGSIREDEVEATDPFLDTLQAMLDERGERMIVVAGADLAHVGPRFGDPEPLSEHHLTLLEKADRSTMTTVTSGDAAGFRDAVLEGGDPRRICGLSPIYATLRVLPGVAGKVLRYEQATDDTGTVTYASAGLWLPS